LRIMEEIRNAPMEVALLGAFAFILGEFALIPWDLLRGRGSSTPGGRRLEPNLPLGYRLRREPDLLLLLRPDGSVAAAFSARGGQYGIPLYIGNDPGTRTHVHPHERHEDAL
jgi:hypothetical protein